MMSASSDGSRLKIDGRLDVSRSNSGRLAIMPYLTTSYRPARNSRRGSVASSSGIHRHRQGLMEGADQVLAERVVDADLPSDGAVHLCQERRRHLNDGDTAQKRRGRKAGDVPDHPSAYRDDRRGPVRPGADQGIVDPANGRYLLMTFAVRDQDRFLGGELFEDRAVQPPDWRARHHEPSRRRLDRIEQ